MARRPKTSVEAGLAAMNKEQKLARLEEKLAAGWLPPEPKEKKKPTRAPDLLEEVTPLGIQLTIFYAIATTDGTVRAKELQRFDAGSTPKPGSGPGQAQTADPKADTEEEAEERAQNEAWIARAIG